MPPWVTILIIALGGALLLEGSVYTLFPGGMKKAMQEMQNLPENQLRIAGIIAALIGVTLIYLLMPKT